MTTISAREFNHDVSAAKRAASTEPVIITDRGQPAYVLLSIEEFRRLSGESKGIVDWLSLDDDIDLRTERLELKLTVPDL
jgi:antitoxin (DNA-binding transcriptional repressor) of toxin-antitoxin stability system